MSSNHEQRWTSERQFFDDEEYQGGAIPESTIRRYRECRRRYLPAEYAFARLGDVSGKSILEIGCGDGGNAILLALKGATRVVGIDISERAIGIAKERAALHGVADRVTFCALPLEQFRPTEQFDVICGWAVLHHLLPVLDSTFDDLCGFASAGAQFVFVEPISLWRWLRQLRLALPIAVHGTPDERPLESRDLAIMRERFRNWDVRYHNALMRPVSRFWLHGRRYEDLAPMARRMLNGLGRLDDILLNYLPLRGFASTATICGIKAEPDGTSLRAQA